MFNFQNKYKLTLKKIENCAGGDAVISVKDDYNVEMTSDCKVKVKGCVDIKAFNSGTITYKVKKGGMVLAQGTNDVCTLMASAPEMAKKMAKGLGIPESCPVSESHVCADEAVDISRFKSFLSFVKGTITIEAKVDHDNGKSCYNIESEIHK